MPTRCKATTVLTLMVGLLLFAPTLLDILRMPHQAVAGTDAVRALFGLDDPTTGPEDLDFIR